jgi:hypothetical protein
LVTHDEAERNVRHGDKITPHARGRDIEEVESAVEFNRNAAGNLMSKARKSTVFP